MLTDSKDRNLPVVVRLTATDWFYVPNRVHTKDVEFDREDWDNLDREGRQDMVDEALREWLNETFSPDAEIVSDDDYDDPVAGE